ncbi:DUF2470 domain-containing protein [Micromonospora sp. CA-263727]|uniref:DUF2470 domain-containing protein n=1 Tax=Micromonospora sp. CA-263727 TaxID=3239967 RepID=UPI003D8D14A7
MSKILPAATLGTPAERLRTILAVTDSLRLRTPSHCAELVGRHAVTADGRLRLSLPARAEVTRDLLEAGEVTALVELTDLAPLPGRDRVRGRATLTGWLSLDDLDGDDVTALLDLAAAELVDADGDVSVDPDTLATARPDPLAAHEADLLRHLHDRHPAVMRQLIHLVPAARRVDAGRVHPLRLDRYGIVLRLELPRHHRDVRIAFATPLATPDDAGRRLAQLIGADEPCRACVEPG